MLSEFPFLTATEFLSACRAFVDRVHACGSLEHLGWSSVRLQQQVREPGPARSPTSFHARKQPVVYEPMHVLTIEFPSY